MQQSFIQNRRVNPMTCAEMVNLGRNHNASICILSGLSKLLSSVGSDLRDKKRRRRFFFQLVNTEDGRAQGKKIEEKTATPQRTFVAPCTEPGFHWPAQAN